MCDNEVKILCEKAGLPVCRSLRVVLCRTGECDARIVQSKCASSPKPSSVSPARAKRKKEKKDKVKKKKSLCECNKSDPSNVCENCLKSRDSLTQSKHGAMQSKIPIASNRNNSSHFKFDSNDANIKLDETLSDLQNS